MSNITKIYLGAIIAWFAFMGSWIILYLVIQASHPKLTDTQRNYATCLNGTSYAKTKDCKFILDDAHVK